MTAVVGASACGPGDATWSIGVDDAVAGPFLVDGAVVVATGDGELLAADPADGEERWRAEVPLEGGDANGDQVVAADVVDGGIVTLTTRGAVCVHDAADGARRWCDTSAAATFRDLGPRQGPRLATAGSTGVVVSSDQRLWSFDARAEDGAVTELLDLARPDVGAVDPTPAVATDGRRILTTGWEERGDASAVVGVSLDGERLWANADMRDNLLRSLGVAFDGDDAIVAGRRRVIRAPSATGSASWTWAPDTASEVTDLPVDALATVPPLLRGDDTVVVVVRIDNDRAVRLVGLDGTTGELRFRGDPFTAGDELAGDVRLTDGQDDLLVALGTDLHTFEANTGRLLATRELGLTRPTGLVVLDGDAILIADGQLQRVALPTAEG